MLGGEGDQVGAQRVKRPLTDKGPPELSEYLAALGANAANPARSTVPPIGQIRLLPSGLWVPADAQLAAEPIDLISTYITYQEVFHETANLTQLRAMLGRYAREHLLLTCGILLRAMVENDRGSWEQQLVQALEHPYGRRLASLLGQGRPVFSRQSLYVLAKLALVDGAPVAGDEPMPIEVAMGFMSLLVHDVLGSGNPVTPDEAEVAPIGGLPARLAMEIIANQWFYRAMDELNLLALYERRWISGSRPSTENVAKRFRDALGFGVEEMGAVALALWAGCRGDDRWVVFDLSWLDPLRLEEGLLDAILSLIAINLTNAASQVAAAEIDAGELAWNFDTFERYPLIRLDEGRVLVLDPALLVRRCLGWAPMYDLKSARRDAGAAAAHALADASEAYALDVLRSMYPEESFRRLYEETAIQAAYGTRRRNADALVDNGTGALVVEITARRPIRGFLRGGSAALFREQLDAIMDEASQISSTARAFDGNPGRLLGRLESRAKHRRLYPVLVMTEGFPSNPITLTAIRSAIAEAGLFEGLDSAPFEVIDLVELELLESLAEAGRDLPALLDAKAASNFHADSVRNYLTTRRDLDLGRSARIDDIFSRPLDRIARALQEVEAGQEPDHADRR